MSFPVLKKKTYFIIKWNFWPFTSILQSWGHSSEYFSDILQTHNFSTRGLWIWRVRLKFLVWAFIFYSNLTSRCSVPSQTVFMCEARTDKSSNNLSPSKSAFLQFSCSLQLRSFEAPCIVLSFLRLLDWRTTFLRIGNHCFFGVA